MIDKSMFLSWFFAKTRFSRTDIYSSRLNGKEVRQRRILMYCLILLGFNKSQTGNIMEKTSYAVTDGLNKISKEDIEYAERLIKEWNEKMREMSSDITTF